MDSVRADHCSAFGYDRETTPELDRLASTRFTDASATAPATPTSVPSFLTSTYPLERGHIAFSVQQTIVDHMGETDYTTGLFNSNIQVNRFGYDSGFDSVVNMFGEIDQGTRTSPFVRFAKWCLHRDGPIGSMATVAKENLHRFVGPIHPHAPDEDLFARAREWVNDVDEPYFLWIHLMDTHYPYLFSREEFEAVSDESYDPNRYARLLARAMTHVRSGEFIWSLDDSQRQYIIDAYDASIRHADGLIGEFVRELDPGRTNVIVTADHGEELWDHGHFGHAGGHNIPRAITLYEEMLRVPLLLIGDDMPDAEVVTPASLVDLYPTIADICGVPYEDHRIRGTSLLDLAEGEGAERAVVAQATSPGDPVEYANATADHWRLTSIKRDGLKYIHMEGHDDELYDLSSDPDERQDIGDQRRGEVDELRSEALSFVGDRVGQQSETDPAVKDRLKELGYLG